MSADAAVGRPSPQPQRWLSIVPAAAGITCLGGKQAAVVLAAMQLQWAAIARVAVAGRLSSGEERASSSLQQQAACPGGGGRALSWL